MHLWISRFCFIPNHVLWLEPLERSDLLGFCPLLERSRIFRKFILLPLQIPEFFTDNLTFQINHADPE